MSRTAARLFKDFAKANPAFEIKAAAFEGEFIPGSNTDISATAFKISSLEIDITSVPKIQKKFIRK